MTIQQLKLFLALCKYLNFSEAADESDISQSSLSKQIRALENELYVSLFNRNTRKIHVTDAGKELIPYATRIVENYQSAIVSLSKYSGQKRMLRIGCIPVMSQYKITSLIAAYERKHPDTELYVSENEPKEVLKSFKNLESDIAIIRPDLYHLEAFVSYPIIEDELCLVAGTHHPLARYSQISLKDAAKEKFLFHEDSYLFDYCENLCKREGFVPNVPHKKIRPSSIIKLVKTNEYVAMLMNEGQRGVLMIRRSRSLNLTAITNFPWL